jgi:hypothetical protein
MKVAMRGIASERLKEFDVAEIHLVVAVAMRGIAPERLKASANLTSLPLRVAMRGIAPERVGNNLRVESGA